MNTRFIIVMGVAGCGKTSVGKSLAKHLGWDFYDADDFHLPENIVKMTNGIPLNHADRSPWLARRVQKPQQKQSGAKHFSSTWMIQVVHSQLIGKSWKNLLGKPPLKQQNRSFKACGYILTDCNRRGRRKVKFLLCI